LAEAVVIQITEAVRASLAGATFSQPIAPQRLYLPSFDLADMTMLQVSVVPAASSVAIASRRSQREDHQVHVAVQKKVDPAAVAAVDDLLQLVQEIDDHLRAAGPMADATWIGTALDPLYHPDHLRDKGVLTCVLSVTYRLHR
jgi:hypothetical protein